jgi:hypothetical protein
MSEDNSRSVDAVAFQIYYFIAVLILGFFAIYTYNTYGLRTSVQFPEGAWMVLGGFSLFFPTSLLLLPFTFWLLLCTISSLKRIKFTQKEKKIEIEEHSLLIFRKNVSISQDEIQSVSIDSGSIGTKWLWVCFYGTHMFLTITDGVHLLTDPYVFGLGFANGWILVISGILDFIVLLLLLIPNECLVKISTKTDVIMLKFSAIRNKNKKIKEIAALFGISARLSPEKIQDETQENLENNVKGKPILPTSLILGVLLILIGLISQMLRIYAGTALLLIFYFFGIMLILKGIKVDPVIRPMNQDKFRSKEMLIVKTNSLLTEKYYSIRLKSIDEEISDFGAYPLDSFTGSLLILLPFLIGLTLSAWFRFIPTDVNLIGYSVLYVVLSAIILVGIVLYILQPTHKLRIQSNTEQISVNLNAFHAPSNKPVEEDNKHSKVTIIKIGVLAISCLIGIITTWILA